MTRGIVLTDRVALMIVSALRRHGALTWLRSRNSTSPDAELTETLDDLELLYLEHVRSSALGTVDAAAGHVVTSSEALTVVEAAEQLGIQPRSVRKALDENRLRGTKHGGTWFISRTDLDAFQKDRE